MRATVIGAMVVLAGSIGHAPSVAADRSSLQAHPACSSHGDVVKMLDQQFSEVPTAVGLQANGHLLQVFAAKDGSSWTIVTTRPDGTSCLVAVGHDWELMPVALGPMT
jgi:hypothetical protein